MQLLVAFTVVLLSASVIGIRLLTRQRNEAQADADRLERELAAALLYERHRTLERRIERPTEVTVVEVHQ